MKEVDARGRPCPEPVIMTGNAIKECKKNGDGEILVLVDRKVARDNVERFARSQGFSVSIDSEGNIYRLRLSFSREQSMNNEGTAGLRNEETGKSDATCEPEKLENDSNKMNLVCYINSEHMGVGDAELGSILMRGFIKTLKTLRHRPEKLIFINGGVKLTTRGSKVIEELLELEKEGVEILSCGTCLDFYNLNGELLAGRASNMFEIATILSEADRVLRP